MSFKRAQRRPRSQNVLAEASKVSKFFRITLVATSAHCRRYLKPDRQGDIELGVGDTVGGGAMCSISAAHTHTHTKNTKRENTVPLFFCLGCVAGFAVTNDFKRERFDPGGPQRVSQCGSLMNELWINGCILPKRPNRKHKK
jgi:hypothetical protein